MPGPVTAERILKDLEKYWASLAGGSGPEGVLRACAMTLIVLAGETDDRAAISETLASVMRNHPHRAIVVQPGAALDYSVSAQCWMGSGRRNQVCCEQIDLTCPADRLDDLAPVLRAIRAPDLPVVIWCRSPQLARFTFPDAGKTILDSGAFEGPAEALALAAGRERVADLAWTRITRWREIVAQVFADPAHCELLPALDAVRVLHAEPRTSSAAYYLAGWIAASLQRDLAAAFSTVAPILGGIEGLVLNGGGHTVSIRRADGPAVLIEVDTLKACTVCPRLGEAELLSNELSMLGRDAVFEKTLPVALRIAAAR